MADSIAEIYGREVHDRYGIYRAVWDPGTHVEVGDIGVLDGEVWLRQSSLSNEGIAFTPRPDLESIEFNFTSRNGVTFDSKLKGHVDAKFANVPKGKAAVAVSFSQAGRAVIRSSSAFTSEIDDQLSLRAEILRRYREIPRTWQGDWVVAVKVVQAAPATIIVSDSSSARIEITADADFGPGDLAKADLDFGFGVEKDLAYRAVAESGLTPAILGLRIKRHPLGDTTVEPTIAPPDARLDDVTPENGFELGAELKAAERSTQVATSLGEEEVFSLQDRRPTNDPTWDQLLYVGDQGSSRWLTVSSGTASRLESGDLAGSLSNARLDSVDGV